MGSMIEGIGAILVIGFIYILLKGSVLILADIFPTIFAVVGVVILLVCAIKEEGCGCGCLVFIGIILAIIFL